MSQEANQRPLIGCGVVVVRDGKVLIGERLSSHGAQTYQIPGGHLEFGKSFEEQARAEVEEETGLTNICFLKLISINNERVYGKHYVSIGFLVECTSGEPHEGEAGKSKNWQWYAPDKIPEPLFAPSKGVLDAWRSGTLVNEITT